MRYLIDFAALAVLYFVVFLPRWRRLPLDCCVVNTLMYLYLALVLYVTLMPVLCSLPHLLDHPYIPMRMEFFADYKMGYRTAVRELVLNVIMTMPFGFLLPVLRRRSLAACALWTLLLSLCIELLQPLLSGARTSDITDLLTNTVGGILGYLLYLLFRPLIRIILQKLRKLGKT